ncbi:MAG: hypothetical protein E7088_08775 [Bacteroidales bacterium]|nr:hypothetical protein [Bacteroidales bacterium]
MKLYDYTYPLLLLFLFAVFVCKGNSLFGYSPQEKNAEEEIEAVQYIYVSPYAELSYYDHHFREAADSINYDWTLIAAIAFTESRFDSTARSSAGATGVMQLMPATLRGLNVPDSLHSDPRTNIMAAAKLLASLERMFRHIKDPGERVKFVLASYNAGYGHIFDAMRLAQKYGYNKHLWEANVDSFLVKKHLPEYYTDSLCRNGEFKDWRQTLSFVNKVHRHWRRFAEVQRSYSDSISSVAESDTLVIVLEE